MFAKLKNYGNPRYLLVRFAVAVLLATATNGSPLAETSQRRADSYLPQQVAEIVKWISAHSDIPANDQPPIITFVPKDIFAGLRYGAPLSYDRDFGSNADQAAHGASDREVAALYNNAMKTIFLPKGWTGAEPRELSILVHELVHHLQNVNNIQYPCPQAREMPAYSIQEKWLAEHGLDLEKEFGIDKFTITVTSACGF